MHYVIISGVYRLLEVKTNDRHKTRQEILLETLQDEFVVSLAFATNLESNCR